jgi:hypothetical protein
MKIYIQGYGSFAEWRDAGYPGARSFPPEGKPDPKAGLCIKDGCDNVAHAFRPLCNQHYFWRERIA